MNRKGISALNTPYLFAHNSGTRDEHEKQTRENTVLHSVFFFLFIGWVGWEAGSTVSEFSYLGFQLCATIQSMSLATLLYNLFGLGFTVFTASLVVNAHWKERAQLKRLIQGLEEYP